jgi:hypothetical protein
LIGCDRAVRPVAFRDARGEIRREIEIGRRHAQRTQHRVARVSIEILGRHLFDRKRRNCRPRIVVNGEISGLPAADEIAARELHALQQRPALLVFHKHAHANVRPAGRVFEQVHEAHRVCRFPRIDEMHLGNERGDGRIERKLVLLDQGHHGDGGDRLRDRARAKRRVGGRRNLPRHIGIAIALGERDFAVLDERERDAGDFVVGENDRQLAIEILDGFRRRCVRRRKIRQSQQQDAGQKSRDLMHDCPRTADADCRR